MNVSGSNGEFIDYYDLLNISPDAGLQQLRVAYIKMAKLSHPDAGGSTEQMQVLNSAYRTLANDVKRKAYDMLHSFHTGTTSAAYFRETGGPADRSNDTSDEFIDFFLDQMYAEYVNPQPKGIKQKLRSIFKTQSEQ